jgi:hypothetical protein
MADILADSVEIYFGSFTTTSTSLTAVTSLPNACMNLF